MEETEVVQKVIEIHGKVHETDLTVNKLSVDMDIIKNQNHEINEGMKSAITKLANSIDVQTRVFNLATLSLQSMTSSKDADTLSTNNVLKYGLATLALILASVCLVGGVIAVKDLNDFLNQLIKLKIGVPTDGL